MANYSRIKNRSWYKERKDGEDDGACREDKEGTRGSRGSIEKDIRRKNEVASRQGENGSRRMEEG